MGASRFGRWLALALLSPGLLSCNSKASKATIGSASARASAARGAPDGGAKRQRKSLAELRSPPLAPSETAESGAEGVKWQLLEPGNGARLDPGQRVEAELSVWSGDDGKLVFSSYSHSAPLQFAVELVPPEILREFSKVRVGGRARFWFAAEFVRAIADTQGGHSPFPKTALVMDYEPLAALPSRTPLPPPPSPSASASAEPAAAPAARRFARPDAAGPPRDALRTSSGLSYVELRAGSGAVKPRDDSKLRLGLTAWPVQGLVVGAPLLQAEPSATTLARAPAGLGSLLRKMTEGAAVRVWLPASKAEQVVPLGKAQELVLDLVLEKIE